MLKIALRFQFLKTKTCSQGTLPMKGHPLMRKVSLKSVLYHGYRIMDTGQFSENPVSIIYFFAGIII